MVRKNKELISNRLLYTFISVIMVIALGVGVYAILVPGGIEDPGHSIQNVSPPSGCTSGQVLSYFSFFEPDAPSISEWRCIDASGGGGSGGSLWTQSGNNIYYNTGNVGIGTVAPTTALDVNGDIKANAFIGDFTVSKDGSVLVATYHTFDEDVYPSTSTGFGTADTCDGVTNDFYTCSVSESRTCKDVVSILSGGTGRDVVCKRAVIFREP